MASNSKDATEDDFLEIKDGDVADGIVLADLHGNENGSCSH